MMPTTNEFRNAVTLLANNPPPNLNQISFKTFSFQKDCITTAAWTCSLPNSTKQFGVNLFSRMAKTVKKQSRFSKLSMMVAQSAKNRDQLGRFQKIAAAAAAQQEHQQASAPSQQQQQQQPLQRQNTMHQYLNQPPSQSNQNYNYILNECLDDAPPNVMLPPPPPSTPHPQQHQMFPSIGELVRPSVKA